MTPDGKTYCAKEKFCIPDGIYLLSHSVGCLPVIAQERLAENYFRQWADYGGNAWKFWLDNLTCFNKALAMLFRSDEHLFCPQVNLSSALTRILFSLSVPVHRRKVIFSERDFPSIGAVIKKYCEIQNLQPVMIPKERNLADLQIWSDFLDDEVAIALVTHVVSNTSQRLPVKNIIELCREREIISIVDVAQSAGIIPVNLSCWQADFVIGSCVKWLCGGPGAGYLWVNEDNVNACRPSDVGWFSHDDPMSLNMDNFEYAYGARRFSGGTPSIVPFTLASESIRLLLSIGIEQIHHHNRNLIDRLTSQLNISPPWESDNQGGTLVVSFSNNQKALQKLSREGVQCDLRNEGLRLSPHIYNSASEIDKLAELIEPLLVKRPS